MYMYKDTNNNIVIKKMYDTAHHLGILQKWT